MITQYDNQLLNSFYYYLDHKIIVNGSGFKNIGGQFYPINQIFGGYQTYSSSFNQLIADRSINGPTIMTGVIISGVFVPPGQSGFHAIDYFRGNVYFSGQINGNISGNFAIKDFNLKFADKSDTELVLENNYWNRLKTTQLQTGLYNDELSYPVIYIRNDGGKNYPSEIGQRSNKSINNIRAVILSDTNWNLDASLSVIKKLGEEYIPIIKESEIPFNVFGYPVSGYNYLNLVEDKVKNGSGIFISSIRTARLDNRSMGIIANSVPNKIYFGIIDFTTEYIKDLNAYYDNRPIPPVLITGQFFIDESGNFLVDESGNFLVD